MCLICYYLCVTKEYIHIYLKMRVFGKIYSTSNWRETRCQQSGWKGDLLLTVKLSIFFEFCICACITYSEIEIHILKSKLLKSIYSVLQFLFKKKKPTLHVHMYVYTKKN